MTNHVRKLRALRAYYGSDLAFAITVVQIGRVRAWFQK